jgi:hypothetical protein
MRSLNAFILSTLVMALAIGPTVASAAEDDVFVSPFSGMSVSKSKFTRFQGMPVPTIIETVQKEGLRVVYLNPKGDPKITDPRNGDLTPAELALFFEYLKLATDGAKQQLEDNAVMVDTLYVAPWSHIPPVPGSAKYRMLPRPETGRIVLVVNPGEWPASDSLLDVVAHSMFEEKLTPKSNNGEKYSRFDEITMWSNYAINEYRLASEAQKKYPSVANQVRVAKALLLLGEWAYKRDIFQLNDEGNVFALQLATYRDFNLSDRQAVTYLEGLLRTLQPADDHVEIGANEPNIKAILSLPAEVKAQLGASAVAFNDALKAADKAVAKAKQFIARDENLSLLKRASRK